MRAHAFPTSSALCQRPFQVLTVALTLLLGALPNSARAANRILQPISPNQVVALQGSVHPLAQARYDVGAIPDDTPFQGVSIDFKLSPTQQADLATLLKQQQTPGSPNYHQWLTPAQYASRFGMSSDDLAKVENWLESQGFAVTGVSASHNRIFFSGTAAQIRSAFQTELHHYQIQGKLHTSNATPISVPTALAGVVLGVRNLSDFRPKPRLIARPSPRYTSNLTGNHFLAPDDFATIYNVNPLYNAGYTGSSRTIVVVGQSAIQTSDIANFRSASGLPANTPTLTLMPNTGTSVANDSSGDEDESDLDVEWSGGIAKNATINFVYVGNSPNYSAFDALQYAIDNDLAPVISISYGACETSFSTSDLSTVQSWVNQANAQGETIVAASGDNGAADCDHSSGASPTVVNGDQATQGLAVDFPGSSPGVTSIGGTTFSEGSNTSYWNSSNNSLGGSATSYIPGVVWNDTSTKNGLAAGGGGVSVIFGKPSWQTGAGVPNDGGRDVPDIALNASPQHDGYLYCASGNDSTSCSNGFLDSSSNLTVAGGTSFGAPTFSGVLTLISQQIGSSGEGNVNPMLYAIAAASPAAFHDITSGNNQVPCSAGSTSCSSSGVIGYSAGPGYDLATGWGAIDAYNLAQAFSARAVNGALIATTTVLTASTPTPVVNSSVTFTVTVVTDTGSSTPGGTVQFSLDGTDAGGPVSLSSGSATYKTSSLTAGSHTIAAAYSGDGAHAASSATLAVTVANASKAFSLSATNVNVTSGSSGTSTITVTPADGYTGTINFTVSAPSTLTNACYSVGSAAVTGTAAVTTALTIYTSSASCVTTGRRPLGGAIARSGSGSASSKGPTTLGHIGGFGATLACVFLIGFPRRRRRLFSAWLGIVLLGVLTLNLGCGGGGGSSSANGATTSSNAPTGAYTLTVTGTDTTANLAASANFTLTVQ